jgi:hypothetical protein
VAIAMIKAVKRLSVVVPGCLPPDLVGDRIGPVGQPGDGLTQRQRRAFHVREVARVPPSRDRKNASVRLACLFEIAGVFVLAGYLSSEVFRVSLLRDDGEHPRLQC